MTSEFSNNEKNVDIINEAKFHNMFQLFTSLAARLQFIANPTAVDKGVQ